MFDVPVEERSTLSFAVDIPAAHDDWQIGLIVGPSGSGKSTVARAAFGDRVAGAFDVAERSGRGGLLWRDVGPTDHGAAHGGRLQLAACLDSALRACSAAASGFAATWPGRWPPVRRPPAGAADEVPIVVFDEFTSVVDRNVAQVGSAAVAKSIRGGQLRCRFVAVTCHYDVAEWLAPDWIVDMADRSCQRRRLRRPDIQLELFRVKHRLWSMFAPHHYLTGSLSKTARCYAAWWRGNAVSFCATLPVIGRRNHWRITRVVTLPDYQGIGIGMRVAEAVCDLHRQQGHRINVTASHPALVAHCRKSDRWRLVRVLKTGSGNTGRFVRGYRSSSGRAVVSFEYLGNRAG